uniref:Uncharacterized protein n=1 Tax=Elaeophora elaphi TaxID=1147741 RepID=A0A0R3S3Q1_9BILA
MQQQHSAAASNSGLSAAVPAIEPTTVTVVDRLKHQLLQAYDNDENDVQLFAGRYRRGHGCDHQIGKIQFDEGTSRGEDISNFHPKLRSEEDVEYGPGSGQMGGGFPARHAASDDCLHRGGSELKCLSERARILAS